MKKYFNNFFKNFSANLLNYRELITALIVGIVILGANVLTGGMSFLLALKILIPYAINVHILVGFLYALFGKRISKRSVK